MATEDDEVFHNMSPRTRQRRSRQHERSNKEFIRRLANDYLHFKIYGTERNTIDDIRERQDVMSSRASRSAMSSDGQGSSLSDSNNNQVESPTWSEPSESSIELSNNDDDIAATRGKDEPFRKASKVLRKVSIELERSNSDFFDNVCGNLNLNSNDAHLTFQHVSEEVLCPDTLNWGRVVSLFTFGGKLAEWFWDRNEEDKIEEVEEWLAESLANKESWIEQHGGWEHFADTFDIEKAKEDTNKMAWLRPGLLMCVGISLAALFTMKMQ